MIGTIVNALAIIFGGLFGLMLKKGINKNYEKSLNIALGIALLITALNGAITTMITVSDTGKLQSSGEIVVIICLVIGVLIGEVLKIDDKLSGISIKIEKRLNLSGFAKSFVSGSLIYCIGAMAIIGAINDGLGDPSVLYIKSMLDGISSIIFAATLGPGVIFSSVPVFVYQGSIAILAETLQPILQGNLLTQICSVGYCLVICISLNFIGVTKIKTANFLPAIALPPIWAFIQYLVGLVF